MHRCKYHIMHNCINNSNMSLSLSTYYAYLHAKSTKSEATTRDGNSESARLGPRGGSCSHRGTESLYKLYRYDTAYERRNLPPKIAEH